MAQQHRLLTFLMVAWILFAAVAIWAYTTIFPMSEATSWQSASIAIAGPLLLANLFVWIPVGVAYFRVKKRRASNKIQQVTSL